MMEMEKTRIKLEVGKYYQDRLGYIVRIISYRSTNERPYLGNNSCAYREDGYLYNKIKSDYDLIEEVTSTTTTTTTDPKMVYEVKCFPAKKSEVSNLEDSLREYICGLVTMGKYQDAKELLNILIEEENHAQNY